MGKHFVEEISSNKHLPGYPARTSSRNFVTECLLNFCLFEDGNKMSSRCPCRFEIVNLVLMNVISFESEKGAGKWCKGRMDTITKREKNSLSK